MRLHLGEFDGQTAGALLRWTLNKKEQEQVKQATEEDREVYIFITIIWQKKDDIFYEEKRLALPITQVATYISFRNPGKHLILAGITDQSIFYCQFGFMSTFGHRQGYEIYETEILKREWNNKKGWQILIKPNIIWQKQASRLSINVGENLFAPQPWDYRIINSWFDTEPINECQHRRRRLFAWPATLVWLAFLYPFGLAFAIIVDLILGLGGLIDWDCFREPLKTPYYYGLNGGLYLKWFQNADCSRKTLKEFFFSWRIMILEIILLFVVAHNWETVIKLYNNISEPINGKLVTIGIVGFFIFLALMSKITSLLSSVLLTESGEAKGLLKKLEEMSARRREKVKQADQAQLLADLEALSPENLPKEITLETLPKKKITLWLELMKWKKEICRPFSGR